ncbi:unnamed protein product [Linum trigynum]|uniref:Uncharacterized protein n=1 Tax=Linum trigynum TaxID=586398 RepID=A0AAV2FDL8_9ROSI
MEGRRCRLTATGWKENEEKNPPKVRRKKKKADVVRSDDHPTVGQLSLSRGTTSTPTPESAPVWQANWSDSINEDDDDDGDAEVGNAPDAGDAAGDAEVEDAPPQADLGVGKTARVGISSTASSHFRGPDGRYASRPSSKEGREGNRKMKTTRKDMSWVLTSESQMCSGGPVIPDVIPSFGGHIGFVLWTSPEQDRGVLDGFHRPKAIETLRRYKWSAEGSNEMVEATG